ncbi:STAS domain-containing protein [Streptomyces sp. NPDC020681]|uniref:STAS domain-containing protein n=1 Tax=Streptomyces sp. NPDC020681 TaxID=3365083 RepID=UPI0037889C30
MDATQPMVMRIAGRVTPADVPRLCEELSARLIGAGEDGTEVICDVGGLSRPDLAAVDALARLQLTARRLGCRISLRGADAELRALLELVGLAEVTQPFTRPSPGASADRTAGTSAPYPGTN